MIRVLLAEDQAMVLGALGALLDIESDLDVVAKASTGTEALSQALALHPDVVVTDIEMPGLSGLELAVELRRRGSRARVVILTTFARPGYLRRALDTGASGYLLKDAPSHRLAEAIRRVHAGGRAVESGARGRGLVRGRPPDRSRAAGAPAGRRGTVRRGDREGPGSVRRHRPQLPVGSDQQGRREESRGSGPHCSGTRLAVSGYTHLH